MFKTHKRGMHEVRKTKSNLPCSLSSGNTYYICVNCGETHRNLYDGKWEDESCREYLQKQKELEDFNHVNPARQVKFKNLSFADVFGDCQSPMEYLERRSVTIDTKFGEPPEDWD